MQLKAERAARDLLIGSCFHRNASKFAQPQADASKQIPDATKAPTIADVKNDSEKSVGQLPDSAQLTTGDVLNYLEPAAATSSGEVDFGGFSNSPPEGLNISAVDFSENEKSPKHSWCNDIIDDINQVNINDLEPSLAVVALNVHYPPAKLPTDLGQNIIGEIGLATVCELLSPLKFWIHFASQYDLLTKILNRLE